MQRLYMKCVLFIAGVLSQSAFIGKGTFFQNFYTFLIMWPHPCGDGWNSITDSRNTIQCWKNDKGFKVIADKRNDNFIGFSDLSSKRPAFILPCFTYSINSAYAFSTRRNSDVMILYHGSNTGNIKVLKPNQADHDRPYVYMTTMDVVAAFYLCNAVERPYYWFPYGFEFSTSPPKCIINSLQIPQDGIIFPSLYTETTFVISLSPYVSIVEGGQNSEQRMEKVIWRSNERFESPWCFK